MKISITESDIHRMVKSVLREMNEITKYQRMMNPSDPSYEEGFEEFYNNEKKYYGDSTILNHWKDKGKFDYYNKTKYNPVFQKDVDAVNQHIRDTYQKYGSEDIEGFSLDGFHRENGYAPSEVDEKKYIVLAHGHCEKGEFTPDMLREAFDDAREKMISIVSDVNSNNPIYGERKYGYYPSYGGRNRELRYPSFRKDLINGFDPKRIAGLEDYDYEKCLKNITRELYGRTAYGDCHFAPYDKEDDFDRENALEHIIEWAIIAHLPSEYGRTSYVTDEYGGGIKVKPHCSAYIKYDREFEAELNDRETYCRKKQNDDIAGFYAGLGYKGD